MVSIKSKLLLLPMKRLKWNRRAGAVGRVVPVTAHNQIRRDKLQREAEGYLVLGMAQQALAVLLRIGDPTTLDPHALYLWGESLRILKCYEEALVPLRRAAEVLPENLQIHLALGWCYKRTGKIHRAVEALERVLASEPNEPLIRYNLACYCSLMGQKHRALRYLAQALKLAPGYRHLIDQESDFDPLRQDPDFQALCNRVQG
jgi:Flp pilus assembly protein TadD